MKYVWMKCYWTKQEYDVIYCTYHYSSIFLFLFAVIVVIIKKKENLKNSKKKNTTLYKCGSNDEWQSTKRTEKKKNYILKLTLKSRIFFIFSFDVYLFGTKFELYRNNRKKTHLSYNYNWKNFFFSKLYSIFLLIWQMKY